MKLSNWDIEIQDSKAAAVCCKCLATCFLVFYPRLLVLHFWENTPYSLTNSGNFHQRSIKANKRTRGRDPLLMVQWHSEKLLDHMSHRRGVAGKQNLASVPAEKMPRGQTFTCFGDYMSLKQLQRLRHCCRNGSSTVQSPKTCWQSTSATWSLSAK